MTHRLNYIVTPTNGVAVAAVFSGQWLSSLEQISAIAARWPPILGLIWLAVQIARAVLNWRG